MTAEPRRYGFHATLKPPMRLAAGRSWAALRRRGPRDGRRTSLHSSFRRWRCRSARIPGVARNEALPRAASAGRYLRGTSSIRFAPRRRRLNWRGVGAAGLTPEQDAMLLRWGYPYVFDTWFFHMTLTRRLSTRRKRPSCRRPKPISRRRCTSVGVSAIYVSFARPRRTPRSPSSNGCRCSDEPSHPRLSGVIFGASRIYSKAPVRAGWITEEMLHALGGIIIGAPVRPGPKPGGADRTNAAGNGWPGHDELARPGEPSGSDNRQ